MGWRRVRHGIKKGRGIGEMGHMRSLAGRNRMGEILWGCSLDGGQGDDVQRAGLNSLYEFLSCFVVRSAVDGTRFTPTPLCGVDLFIDDLSGLGKGYGDQMLRFVNHLQHDYLTLHFCDTPNSRPQNLTKSSRSDSQT